MSSTEVTQLEGIVWLDPSTAQEKLDSFTKTAHRALILDWDGTMTTERGGTWHSLCAAETTQAQASHTALYNHYHALEEAGLLTPTQYADWTIKALQNAENDGMSAETLIASALQHTKFRPGAQELPKVAKAVNMASFVVSASLDLPITGVARHHGMPFDEIISTPLRPNGGTLQVPGRHELVTSGNKQARLLPHMRSRFQGAHDGAISAIVVGDNLHDAAMTAGSHHLRFMVGECAERLLERTNGARSLQQNGFDAVLPAIHGLTGIVKLIQRLTPEKPTTTAR